jgi:hypothetical protein
MFRFMLGLPFSYRQKKLARDRPQIDKATFVARISAQGGDERAAGLVWNALLANRMAEGFTPYPEDSLGRVYGIADEELDEDLIARTLKELSVPLPDLAFVKALGEIDTPLRVAQFVKECRRAI